MALSKTCMYIVPGKADCSWHLCETDPTKILEVRHLKTISIRGFKLCKNMPCLASILHMLLLPPTTFTTHFFYFVLFWSYLIIVFFLVVSFCSLFFLFYVVYNLFYFFKNKDPKNHQDIFLNLRTDCVQLYPKSLTEEAYMT